MIDIVHSPAEASFIGRLSLSASPNIHRHTVQRLDANRVRFLMHLLSGSPLRSKRPCNRLSNPVYQYPNTKSTRNGTVKKFSVVIA